MATGDLVLASILAYDGKLLLDADDAVGLVAPFMLWGITLLMVIDQWACLYLLWKLDASHPAPMPGRCECRRVEAQKGTQCSICLEDFDATAVAINPCSHAFHESCLQKWIEISPTCPICRADVAKQEGFCLVIDD